MLSSLDARYGPLTVRAGDFSSGSNYFVAWGVQGVDIEL
jgi:hypothetical protein